MRITLHLIDFGSNLRYENVKYHFGQGVRDEAILERTGKDEFVIEVMRSRGQSEHMLAPPIAARKSSLQILSHQAKDL